MKLLFGFSRGLAAAVVALALAAPALAQVSTFDLSGTALDQTDAVLPGATVSLGTQRPVSSGPR